MGLSHTLFIMSHDLKQALQNLCQRLYPRYTIGPWTQLDMRFRREMFTTEMYRLDKRLGSLMLPVVTLEGRGCVVLRCAT